MHRNRKIFYCWAALVVFFGLALRLMVARDLLNRDPQVLAPSVYSDMYTYKSYSEQIVRGEFSGEYYYQPFYYAVFLPALKMVLGFGPWPPIVSQALLSTATIWLAGMTAAMLRGRRAGIAASLLIALSSIMIIYIPYHLLDTLQAFWVALTGYYTVRLLKRRARFERVGWGEIIHWGAVGGILGLGILTRGNIWFFVPGIAVACLVSVWGAAPAGRRLLPVAGLLLMVILPQIPFTWRNTRITGNISGPSTAAGAVLSLGNTPESPPGGREPGMGPGPMEYPETFEFWVSNEKAAPVWMRILQWFAREPTAFLELQFRKFLLFWDRREIPNNIAIEYQGLMSTVLQIFGLIPQSYVQMPEGKMPAIAMNIVPSSIILMTLGFAGVLLSTAGLIRCLFRALTRKMCWGSCLKGHLAEYVLLYMVVTYCLGTVAFYILARFRLPALPLVAVFAGCFLDRCISRYGKGIIDIGLSAVILFSLFFVNFSYDIYRYRFEAPVHRLVRPHGVYSPMDETFLVQDHGPFSFGSWDALELRQGVELEKLFNVPREQVYAGRPVSFRVEMFWALPGQMILRVNGHEHLLKESLPGKKMYEFEISDAADMRVSLKPVLLDARVLVAVDRQRDYSRTYADGKSCPGELVCSLVYRQ